MTTSGTKTEKMAMAEIKQSKPVGRTLHIAFEQAITRYIVIITLIIAFFIIFEAIYDGLLPPDSKLVRFLSAADKQLAINFIEWFGVLYGFLLPTILVRVWEQFDEIDNVFDKEADAIEMLLGDLLFLHSQNIGFSLNVLISLQKYVNNVIDFINSKITSEYEVAKGNELLSEIRKYYLTMFRQDSKKQKENDVIMTELLEQLNNIIDYRGDRISLSTQRLFESLNFIAIITSIVWLVPFYFLYFQNQLTGEELQLGIFGWLLVIVVTFLVIIILTIIDDLDEPFGGYWRVNAKSWEDLANDIEAEIGLLQNENRQPEIEIAPEHTIKGLFSVIIDILSYLFNLPSRYLPFASRMKSKS